MGKYMQSSATHFPNSLHFVCEYNNTALILKGLMEGNFGVSHAYTVSMIFGNAVSEPSSLLFLGAILMGGSFLLRRIWATWVKA